ncbi:MAG: BTAD domain-containing putative transcriptional regulator [Gemmatimonadota bacterium]
MVTLRTLGTLDLSVDRTDGSSDLTGQPKRVALLIFLVLQPANRPVHRDKLLGLFWPELSQKRGRRALSQSLYVLRRSLGERILQANGNDAIRLNRSLIRCDAVEFEDAVREGDQERALSLYDGDLLDGFYLPDAPDFEHWLEVERARMRRLAAESADALADRYEASGDLVAASRWARRLVSLTPWDETNLVRLIRLLRDCGDQSGAQLEYDLYCRRLQTELDSEPSAFIESALLSPRETVTRVPQDRPTTFATPEGVPEGPVPAAAIAPTVSSRRQNRWRTPAVLALVVVVWVFFFAKTSQQAFRGSGVDRVLPHVLVTPLANSTDDGNLDALARLAADWLSHEIARTGRVTVIPPVSALRLVQETRVEGDTSMIARIVAAGVQSGVDVVIGGYVSGTRDSMVLEVYALDPSSGEMLFALDPIRSTGGSTEIALAELREATMGALAGQLDERMRQWTGPASQPPSYQAYQEYADALDTFLDGNWQAQSRSVEMFISAWRSDTTFTAPLIWSIFAMLNSGQGDRADSVAHALESRAASLPEWDRAMLRYHLAWLHGDLAAQYRTATEVVSLAPDSEWRYLLAGAAKKIGCRDEALAVLRDLSPRSGWMSRWASAYWLTRLDVRHLQADPEGESHDATTALEQLTDEIHPGQAHRALVGKVRAAAIAGSRAELESYLGEVRSLGPSARRLYMKLFSFGPFDLASDRVEYRVIMDSARAWYADRPATDQETMWYLAGQQVLAYRAGLWSEAESWLDRMTQAGWPPYAEYGFGPRAVLAARRGDVDRARAILDSMPPVEHTASFADYDQDFFLARVAAIAGEPASAVAHLRAANRKGIPYDEIHGEARIDFESIWDYPPLQRLLAGHSCEGI